MKMAQSTTNWQWLSTTFLY